MKVYNDILELIGNTPLVRLNKINEGCIADIVAKLEFFNPASSIKDRLALGMIKKAEQTFIIEPHKSTIIEPTSGNTGIGLAMVCAVRGYELILTMPSNMSIERQKLIKAFGAKIELTEAAKGMQGAIDRAIELSKIIPGSFIPYQFKNPANPETHFRTTAEEIWKDTNGNVDVVVGGVGTGGTLMGISTNLKLKKKGVKVIAVEPEESPVLSGGQKGPHGIQGIGAGFVPQVVNLKEFDDIIKINTETAMKTARKMAKQEGILCGISSGAAVAAALELGKLPEFRDKVIVVIIPDSGERYLSTELYKED